MISGDVLDTSSMLITGANGLVGSTLAGHFPEAAHTTRADLDITDERALADYDWSGVKYIVNAAVRVSPEYCETPQGREDAWAVNARGVRNLANVALSRGITVIQFCSEYVFDGTRSPHGEDEPLSPLNVYGQTKAAASLITDILPQHYTLRTSWVFGKGRNFVDTMTRLADQNISPVVVADQIGRLTSAELLAEAVDHVLTTEPPSGTYNVTNSGESISWADVARRTFSAIGRDDLQVTNTTTEDYAASRPDFAPRPLQSTLALDKIEATGFRPRDWQDDLATYLQGR